jgi:hypothetical protein
MAKPTKTACAREGEIERKPFAGDLNQQILAGLRAHPGGILGFLDKLALEPTACWSGAQVRGIFRDAGRRPGGRNSPYARG